MQAAGSAFWVIQDQNIPIPTALGFGAALLIEAIAFLSTGSPAVRERLGHWKPIILATALTGITPVTWLVAGGGAPWQGLAATVVTAVIAYWYIVLRKNEVSDVALLFVYGAVALTRLTGELYPAPWIKAPAPIIGELAFLRTLVFSVLVVRRDRGTGYGFFPSAREWRTGVKWFAAFVPIGILAGMATGFATLRQLPEDPARIALSIIGTFFGHFVFVALREEFIFRGLLLPRFRLWLGTSTALFAVSVLFGLVHLPMGGRFPNWPFVIVAGIAGFFYAKSYLETGSIRSAMVTHALTNVVARVFLTT